VHVYPNSIKNIRRLERPSFMSAFYTPIFERGWLKRVKEEDEKQKQEKEPKYVPDPDEEYEEE
jgi:hypothetical protein